MAGFAKNKVKPNPVYEDPIGPSEPVEGPPNPYAGIGPQEPVQGPPMPGAMDKAKGFFTELGQLMKKWGAPTEALGKIAPVASQLFRFVAPVGLAMGVASEAKRDLPGVVSALTPRSFDDVPDTPGGSPFEKWYTSAPDNPMKFLSGDSTQNASAEPTQQPSGSAPAEVAQQPQSQPSEAPTAAQAQAEPAKEVPAAEPTPAKAAVPDFVKNKPAAKAAPITNPSKGKAAPKQEKPLSDEDIVTWNARHNKSFAPQEGGSVPFQPAQGAKQSDGVLFVGGNVYMADPRSPDGYKLIHSYGK